jgi:predicted acyltransferase (DUF342 family)
MMRQLVPAAVLCFALLIPSSSAAVPLVHDNGDGTMTDQGTGLTWVADRAVAKVLPRAEALRHLTAMNAGVTENFGRTDWRLPTERELRRISSLLSLPRRPFGASRSGPGLPSAWANQVVLWPVSGSAVVADLPAAAIVATNSAVVRKNTHVTGDVVVNDASPGPTLSPGFELAINQNAVVQGGLKADSIAIDPGASVSGGVSYNQLTNQGSIAGALSTPLPLPVFSMLPAFQTATLRPGAADVFVAAFETRTLPAGDYGLIEVAATGTVVFTGGLYNVRSIHTPSGSCAFPCRSLRFAAPADVRVAERLDAGSDAFVGPAAGSGVTAAQIIFYVGGIDGTTGSLGSLPRAVNFGKANTVQANVYAPNGTVALGRDSAATGAFLARDVLIDQSSSVSAASYFANRPPVANPQTVFTNGAAAIVITLTGSDPENGDLTFSIVSGSGPTQGSLGPVTPNPPTSPPPEPGRDPVPPSVTSATVTYTPATAGNLEDSFVFQVQDPLGATGQATVQINPSNETPPPPPPDTVVASDGSDSTFKDRPVTLTLQGNAPTGVALTFSIVAGSGPASGTLGTLIQGSETPRRSATVVYTPGSGFTGSDGFQFEACGVIAGNTVCDTASVTITVLEPPTEPSQLADDQTVTTLQDQAVQITLTGTVPSGSSLAVQQSVIVGAQAAFLHGSAIAGNVADSDANGLGDNHNALPGSAPVFVSAGVGQSGGAGSNGTVRIQIEWDLSSLQGLGNLQSASVLLHTHRGTTDSLDTSFFAVAGGDGTLTDSDFQATGEPISGAVMPVPPLSELAVGEDGTFSFDVLGNLQAAISAGAPFFSVQGRVNESLAGPARGLEVRSTASSNLASFLEPQLSIATPGVTPAPTFSVLSLPAHGSLRNSLGDPITTVPTTLPDAQLSYTPTAGFIGDDGFTFRGTFDTSSADALVTLHVISANCAINPAGCDNGR